MVQNITLKKVGQFVQFLEVQENEDKFDQNVAVEWPLQKHYSVCISTQTKLVIAKMKNMSVDIQIATYSRKKTTVNCCGWQADCH